MYICSNCQTEYAKWQGKCDSCNEWSSIEENPNFVDKKKGKKSKSLGKPDIVKPVKFSELSNNDSKTPSFEIKTKISEFDNTLGGRILPGQVILLAGAPGIGKSTLSLEAVENLSKQNLNILYITGEESPTQIKNRADRLKLKLVNVSFFPEMNVNAIRNYVASNRSKIDFIIVDSIQTLYSPNVTSTTGSVSQISESTNELVNLAKGFSIPTIIIGHITKSGDIAGPKILEHMVDTVLYFEGDKKYNLRILRVKKNRFGPTDEVGIFKMTEDGLKEIKDTKELFDPSKQSEPGSVFSMVLEGNRSVVVEVQALATKTYFSIPRRTASGFELNRLHLLLAVIDKKLHLKTQEYDIYVNITGGIKVKDPGLDFAVLWAIISSIKNIQVPRQNIFFGEVGLTGEIRKVIMQENREKEAKRLGFTSLMTNKVIKNVKELK
ncbi:MAG: DNA repair protein RadA [Candidatus Dojkabacteria bacterium]|nr:DNA repair protein RadA [Candidatus Dojkabacteria bacterium]MDQ7021611.1 DNA repair protein RadA [Candidatus Dojkabacteria bacterium]